MKNGTLCIDIGGTKTHLAIINENKEILLSERFFTESNPQVQINNICEKVKEFIPLKARFSLPGVWDEYGILKESVFLKNYINSPFLENLCNTLNIKDYKWETDVICGGLGEYFYGKHNTTSLLYINLGTGIGGAFIKDGIPLKSKRSPGMRLHKLISAFDEETISSVDFLSGGNIPNISNFKSYKEVFDLYEKLNVQAIDFISKAQIQLATLLINLYYILSPEKIVLNGGLTNNWSILAEGSIDIVNEELNETVQITPSTLGDLAPIWGAYHNI